MKKRRLKRWVKKILVLIIIYSVGFGFILLMCARAEQIDKAQKKNYQLRHKVIQSKLSK